MNIRGSRGVIHLPRDGGGVNGHVVPRCYAGVPRRVTASTYTTTDAEITCGNCIDMRARDTVAWTRQARGSGGRRPARVAEADSARQQAHTVTRGEIGTHTPANLKPPAARTPGAHKPAKNGVAEDRAAQQAQTIMARIIEKIIAARGTDTVGDDDEWADERREGVSDEAYDLAVEVRKARVAGGAWWRIAYDLELPGHGPSAAQGKSGAAYARRLWERAWGKTYVDGERAPRDTKERKRERALATEGRPYFAEDAQEQAIIAAICGQTIHWNARLGDRHGGLIVAPQEAIVHHDPRMIKISMGPKGRFVEFYEQIDASMLTIDPRRAIAKTGPRRAVYVHSIERVGR